MLTNNNKRSFVKLLALTLAALMVFSVCLTGCSDKTAQQMASDAQATADAAVTDEELQAAIKKIEDALSAHVADGVTKAQLDEALAALKTCTCPEDVEGKFAAKADKTAFDELAAKVNALTDLSEDEVKEIVKTALADYAVKTEINKMIDDKIAGAMTADKIMNIIKDKLAAYEVDLSGYYNKAEVDALLKDYVKTENLNAAVKGVINEVFGGDMSKIDAGKLYAAMNAIVSAYDSESETDGFMTLDQWNQATGKVIDMLNKVATVLDRADKQVFTNENKGLINYWTKQACGEFVIFFDANSDSVLDEYDAAKVQAGLAEICIAILRAPNMDTVTNKIMANLNNALSIPSFEDELKGLRDGYLYVREGNLYNQDNSFVGLVELGQTEKVDNDKNNVADKDAANKDIEAQVVTYEDEENIQKFREALDALIVEYATDINNPTYFEFTKGEVYKKYSKVIAGVTVYNYFPLTATAAETTGWTAVAGTETIGVDIKDWGHDDYATPYFASLVNPAFTYVAPLTWTEGAGKYILGYHDDIAHDTKGEPVIKVAGDYTAIAGLLDTAMKRIDNGEMAQAYAAVETMIVDVENALTDAKTVFTAFLDYIDDKVVGETPDNTAASNTDAKYVDVLRDYMVAEEFANATVYCPAAWQPAAAGDYLVAPYYLYEEVKDAFNYAENINGVTGIEYEVTADNKISYDGFTEKAAEKWLKDNAKYDLYIELLSKAWDEIFELLRDRAIEAVNTMYRDYSVAVMASKLADDDRSMDITGRAAKAATALNYTKYNATFTDVLYAGGTFIWEKDFFEDVLNKDVMETINLRQYVIDSGKAYKANAAKTAGEAIVADVIKNIATNEAKIRKDLKGAIVFPLHNLQNMTATTLITVKDAEGNDVQKTLKAVYFENAAEAFAEEIESAKLNLDEIIYRYTYGEMIEGILCSLYASITADVEFDNAPSYDKDAAVEYWINYTAGMADYYTADAAATTADRNAIVKELSHYLTGWDNLGNTAGTATDAGQAWKTLLANVPANGPDMSLSTIVPDEAWISTTAINRQATQIVKDALEDRVDIYVVMENKAIEIRFEAYLQAAKDAILFTYDSYRNAVEKAVLTDNYKVALGMQMAENDAQNMVAVIQTMHDRHESGYATMDYKSAYQDVLAIVIASDSTYYGLLNERTTGSYDAATNKITTAATYNELLKAVKSSDAAGYTGVVKPEVCYNGVQYYSVGTLINALDELLNADDGTDAYKMNGTTRVELY